MRVEALLAGRERLRESILGTRDPERLARTVQCSLERAGGYQMAAQALTQLVSLNLPSQLDGIMAQIVMEHSSILSSLDNPIRARLLDHYPDVLDYIVR